MMRSLSGTVDATPAQAIHVLADPGYWPSWRHGVHDVRSVSDEPVQSASSWVETHDVDGRSVELLAHAVHVDPMHAFAYRAQGDGIEALLRWTAQPRGGRCLVTQDVTVRARGLKHVFSGTAGVLQREHDRLIDELRVRLHRLHPATRPPPQASSPPLSPRS